MNGVVECRSDWEYAQRPLAFTWQGQRVRIQDVIAEYSIPSGKHFIVTTEVDGCFDLLYHEHLDQWTIKPKSAKESA